MTRQTPNGPGRPTGHGSESQSTTTLLERLIIPEHDDDFWQDLRATLADEPERIDTNRQDQASRIMLMAAMLLLLVLAVSVLTRWPGFSGVEPVETDPAPNPDSEGGASVDDDVVTTTARGDDREWFRAHRFAWDGDRFVAVTASGGDSDSHWTSEDGVDWDRHDGTSAIAVVPYECPDGFTCDVDPVIEDIPFHFAKINFEVVARSGDTILLQASARYDLDQLEVDPPEGELPRGPQLHPDLLRLAAETDGCVQQVLDAGQGLNAESAHIAEVQWGGTSDPVIRISCQPAGGERFRLDLREHLTPEQIQRVYSTGSDPELWVETQGAVAQRVPAPPTVTYSADGDDDRTWSTNIVTASEDRFWAVDQGELVSSVNGVDWQVEPLFGSAVRGVLASGGGHIAVLLSAESSAQAQVGSIAISHDGGRTWSGPIPRQTHLDLRATAVGPAGLAYTTDRAVDGTRRLVLVDGDREVFSRTLVERAGGLYPAAVGEDRIIVNGHDSFDVYSTDGRLLHEVIWSSEGGWFSRNRLALTAVVVAAYVGALMVLRRRRDDVSFDNQIV